MQPVAPPSPDYIPGPEDPQTPPSLYTLEYIPLEDDHEFSAEEQPLPLVDSPTAESPGYVTELDPEEDPEEYKDDETEDGPIDYPMDGGDDGDDDDRSGDDADEDEDEDDEDEDDEDEEKEEEEKLAPADSTIVAPVDEPVFPPEGTEPVILPPFTEITIGARLTSSPAQISISLPPEAEVERLLAMTTPSLSPPISLSPPSTGERLARCTALPAHLSPLPMPSPLLPSSGLPTPCTPPLPPSLYIPPPVDRMVDILESEQPPRNRLCLSTLGSRYEIRESSTARPTKGRGIDYGFVSMVDAEERRHGIRDVGVTELPELPKTVDTQDLYALLEDAQDSRSRISQRVDMDPQQAHSIGLSQATHQELQTHRDHVYAHETHLQAHQIQLQMQQSTLIQTQHQRQMRREMSDMQAELLSLRGQQRRARQPRPKARIPDHQDAFGDADSHI
ncbi:hypothetical protein Tco_0687875 [Tanacetum coccineum]